MNATAAQKQICIEHGAIPFPCSDKDIIHFVTSSLGMIPVKGIRRQKHDKDSGWYIWCGGNVYSGDAFQTYETLQIIKQYPIIEQCLALPAGFCFLVAGSKIKIWHDAEADIGDF